MAPKPHPTSPLLFPFQKHRTTLYTPTNTPLPCTIEPTSSRSFITFSTLETYFPPLHLQLTDFYTPLPSVISPSIYNPIIKEEGGGGVAKVKVLKRVKLPFAFRDETGKRVEVVAEVLVGEDKGLEGVRLGCDFLRAWKGVVGSCGGEQWLVLDRLGGGRVRVEGV
jgi:hypothetical protein